MRKIEKVAEEKALKSSTNNEPKWIKENFLPGADYLAKEVSKHAKDRTQKLLKIMRTEDVAKPRTEVEIAVLKSRIEENQYYTDFPLKLIEEELE